MKVKFVANLGSRDAGTLGLDHTKCTIGSELTVSKEQAQALGGLVEVLEEPKPTVKAVPPKTKIAKAKDDE